jgi:hypothetical protein
LHHHNRRVAAARRSLFVSVIAAAVIWIGLTAGSAAPGVTGASVPATTPTAVPLHAERVHSARRWHAERVHQAQVRHARALRRAAAERVAEEAGLYVAWSRVAVCEEGGWIGSSGPAFPDSLGIEALAWTEYGGGSDVSPFAQIAVGERLIHALGVPIPDAAGCASW